MGFHRTITATIAALTLAACATGSGPIAPAASVDASGSRATPEAMPFIPTQHVGIWISQGYGTVLAIAPDRTRIFDVAAAVCVEEKRLDDSILPFFDLVRREDEGTTLVLSSVVDPYEYRFVLADRLPSACEPPTPDTAVATFDAFATYFGRQYAFFDLWQVDWPARVAAVRPRIGAQTTPAQLYDAMVELVAPMRDSHIAIAATIDGTPRTYDGDEGAIAARFAAEAATRAADGEAPADAAALMKQFRRAYWRTGIGETLLGGQGTMVANGRIQYGMIDDVGYLAIASMGGFIDADVSSLAQEVPVLDAALDEALRRFEARRARAVIVDLSVNTGGYDFIALAIASRFASAPVVAYTRRAGDDRHARDFPIRVSPSARVRYTGPVYVMTTGETVSAGEVLTLALRALPNVTHVGEATRGSLSTVLPRTLPNGWTIGLSNEIYTDPSGEVWEGRGIPPAIAIPVFADDPPTRHVAAVRDVVHRAHDGDAAR